MDSQLDRTILEFFDSFEMKPDSRFIVGFSGGADSTALLYLMHQFNKTNSFQLSAACLNHNLRNSHIMEKEEAVIRRHCQTLNIPLVYHSLEKGECDTFCAQEGLSPEEGARILRYRFFQSLIKNKNQDYILLAHTRDDQVETVLLRFLQGVGAEGLKGISSYQSNRIRPLLGISKNELLNYLKIRQISFCHDHTNDENRYYRNRVRNELLPFLKSILPGVETSLIKQGRYFKEIAEIIETQGEKLFSWKKSGPFLLCDSSEFIIQKPEIREADLQKQINTLRKGTLKGTIPSRFFDPLRQKETFIKNKTSIILDSYDIFLMKNETLMILGKKSTREECLYNELKKNHFFSLWDYQWGVSKEPVEKKICIELVGSAEDYFIRPSRRQDRLLIKGKLKKIDKLIPSGGKVVHPHVLVNKNGNITALIFHNGITPVLKTADYQQIHEKRQTETFFLFIL